MKKLLIIFSLLLLSSLSYAQYTTTTATVTDTGGQIWAGGSWSASLRMPANKTGTPLLNGVPIDCTGGDPCLFYSGALDNTGSFSKLIPDNTKITPSGSVWVFTICPNASSNCDSTSVQISGASQSISGQLSAVAISPQVTPQPTLARSYNDSEVMTAPGQSWLDVTLGVLKFVAQDGTIKTIGGGGGGGTPGGSDQQVQVNQAGSFAGYNYWTVNYGATPPTQTFKGVTYPDGVNDSIYITSDFNFTVAPAGTISVGANTVTLTACPKGVSGTNPLHYVWLSATGTPEAVKITGGTCTGNGTSGGTLIFTAANTHSAGFTISSASGGLKEASEFAKYIPTNPNGTNQSGKVILQAKSALSILATTYITAYGQSLDLSSGVLECNVSNAPCLFIGDPTNANAYYNIKIQNPKCRAMVPNTSACIEDNANKTTIYNLGARQAFTGGYFGYLVQVDNDQAFNLDGVAGSEGAWARCDATFCSSAVYAPGPFGTNAAVGWLTHMDLSGNCGFNGVKWLSGNTVHISDSVIQGYPQFGEMLGNPGGGFGNAQIDNVYNEVGSCLNPVGYDATNFPIGLGQAGVIDYSQAVTIRGGEGPAGQLPYFNSQGNTGATRINYYLVGHSTTWGVTYPMLIGYAKPTGSGSILGQFYALCTKANNCGTVTYDIIASSGVPPNPTTPVGTGNFAVPGAQGITGSCVNNICSFTDTRVALTTYSVQAANANAWLPYIGFQGNNFIYSNNQDINNNGQGSQQGPAVKFYGTGTIFGLYSYFGPQIHQFWFDACSGNPSGGAVGNSNLLVECAFLSPVGNNSGPLGASVRFAGTLTGGDASIANKKGRVIWENGANTGPTALYTFFDADFGNKVAADPYGRPTWDQGDIDLGIDTTGTNTNVGLFLRSSGSISRYINVLPNISTQNWSERLTATLESLKVPLSINSASNQLIIAPSANSYIFNFGNPSASRTITVSDPGAAAVMLLGTGAFTVGNCLKYAASNTVVDGGASCGGSSTWGLIGGTLSAQTDLQTVLNGLAPLASPVFTGAVTISGTISAPCSDQAILYNAGGVVSCDDQITYDYVNKVLNLGTAYIVTTTWPASPLTPPGAGSTTFGVTNTGDFVVCKATGTCNIPGGLTTFPDGTTTAPGFASTNHPPLGLAVVLSKFTYTITNVARDGSNNVTITVSTPNSALTWPVGSSVNISGLVTPYNVLNGDAILTAVTGSTPTSTFTYVLTGSAITSAATSGSAKVYQMNLDGYSVAMSRFYSTSNNPADNCSICLAHTDSSKARNVANTNNIVVYQGVSGVDEIQYTDANSGAYIPQYIHMVQVANPTVTRGANDVTLYIDSTTHLLTCKLGVTPVTCMPSGGTGTPGGSSSQVQYNNAGAFGGATQLVIAPAAGQDIGWTQAANGDDLVYAVRATDTSPTGNLIHFQNAAKTTDLFVVDVGGNLTAVNNITATGQLTLPLGSGSTPSLKFGTSSMTMSASSTAQLTMYSSGTAHFTFLNGTLQTLNTGRYAWATASNSTGSVGTALCRQSDGVVEISTSGTCNNQGALALRHLYQGATGDWAGQCTMAAGTSCTITLTAAYTSTPGCVATIQGTTPLYAACSVSGTTVTITASSSNSNTWAAMLFGNPN